MLAAHVMATEGGFAFGTDAHTELLSRMRDLAERTSVVDVSDAPADGAAGKSKELMEAAHAASSSFFDTCETPQAEHFAGA